MWCETKHNQVGPRPLKIDILFQYAFLLMAILVVESTILFFGYLNREEITAGFHAAMSNGLQFYGKEPSLSSVVDDIQSTVSINQSRAKS